MTDENLPDVIKIHRTGAPRSVSFKLIIISDSRYKELKEKGTVKFDKTTEVVREIILSKGHKFKGVIYTPDEINQIRKEIMNIAFSKDEIIDIIITSGGTGITSRDVTVEAIKPLLQKELPGFSVLFHNLSYTDVGAATLISRAVAGIINRKIIFCLPGSPRAVKLALEKIILPEVEMLVKHVNE